jgi:ATP-dependent exoDNAse (exonuclease V) alpha subunit
MAKKPKVFKQLEVLIVDEISMVRADLLDCMDYFLRRNRQSNMPFGGVQVVFFGDLFQLPPVVSSPEERQLFTTEYTSPYFFDALVMEEGFELEFVELNEVYRQEDRRFKQLLDAIRHNELDYDILEELNSRYLPDFESQDFYITLSTINQTVDKLNLEKLQGLKTAERAYAATVSGQFDERLFPTDALLKLKEEAQVMFLRNDTEGQYVNGTIGKIRSLEREHVIVQTETASGQLKDIRVEPVEWEILRYSFKEATNELEPQVVGSFKQMPLRLAWAITIHKSQGKTFDKCIIDLSRGAFEHGQTYVALSRCRTFEGIVLKRRITGRDVMVDPRVIEFYDSRFR